MCRQTASTAPRSLSDRSRMCGVTSVSLHLDHDLDVPSLPSALAMRSSSAQPNALAVRYEAAPLSTLMMRSAPQRLVYAAVAS